MVVVGPFSTQYVRYNPKPADITAKLKTHFKRLPPRPKIPAYAEALRRAAQDYKLAHKIHPYHLNDVIRRYPHPERSPGLPYTTEGMRHKYEVPPNRIKSFIHNIKYGHFKRCKTPCNAVAKTVVAKEPKFRLIWVYPCHMTMAEGMFTMPLVQAYQAKRGSNAIWVQYTRGHMKTLLSRRIKGYEWMGLDWSAFDSNVPAWMIRDAFKILRDQLDFSEYQEWGKPTDDATLDRLWNALVHYFINTPVKFPDGHVEVTHDTVPSGSGFTNLVDSVSCSIMKHFLLIYHAIKYQREANWECGDDGKTSVEKGKVNLLEIAHTALKTFGAIMNTEKSELGEHVSFMGYKPGTGLDHGIPQASYTKLTAQLLLPSCPDRSINDFATRIRALQLSCFGIGCRRFLYESQSLLVSMGIPDPDAPHIRSELRTKLEFLNLEWPSLNAVIGYVYSC